MDDRVVESTGTPPQYAMVESWPAAGNAWNEQSERSPFAAGVRRTYLSEEDVEQLMRHVRTGRGP